MKRTFTQLTLALALFAAAPANASSVVLPTCDLAEVQATLQRVYRLPYGGMIVKVIQASEVQSADITEQRWCRAEVLTSVGMYEAIYSLKWTSETDRRYWLQVEGGRRL